MAGRGNASVPAVADGVAGAVVVIVAVILGGVDWAPWKDYGGNDDGEVRQELFHRAGLPWVRSAGGSVATVVPLARAMGRDSMDAFVNESLRRKCEAAPILLSCDVSQDCRSSDVVVEIGAWLQ